MRQPIQRRVSDAAYMGQHLTQQTAHIMRITLLAIPWHGEDTIYTLSELEMDVSYNLCPGVAWMDQQHPKNQIALSTRFSLKCHRSSAISLLAHCTKIRQNTYAQSHGNLSLSIAIKQIL